MTGNNIGKIFGKWKSPEGEEFIAVELDVDIFHNKGIEYLEKKDYKRAIEMFKKEIGCAPTDFSGHWELGNLYKEIGELKLSKENYKIALANIKKKQEEFPTSDDEKSIAEMIKKDLESLGEI